MLEDEILNHHHASTPKSKDTSNKDLDTTKDLDSDSDCEQDVFNILCRNKINLKKNNLKTNYKFIDVSNAEDVGLTTIVNHIQYTRLKIKQFSATQVKTVEERNAVESNIEEIKKILRDLDDIPDELIETVDPYHREKISNQLSEDYFTLQEFALRKLEVSRLIMARFDAAYIRLQGAKRTRKVDTILKDPQQEIPDDLLKTPKIKTKMNKKEKVNLIKEHFDTDNTDSNQTSLFDVNIPANKNINDEYDYQRIRAQEHTPLLPWSVPTTLPGLCSIERDPMTETHSSQSFFQTAGPEEHEIACERNTIATEQILRRSRSYNPNSQSMFTSDFHLDIIDEEIEMEREKPKGLMMGHKAMEETKNSNNPRNIQSELYRKTNASVTPYFYPRMSRKDVFYQTKHTNIEDYNRSPNESFDDTTTPVQSQKHKPRQIHKENPNTQRPGNFCPILAHETTEEDLIRFHREANFPSVKRKVTFAQPDSYHSQRQKNVGLSTIQDLQLDKLSISHPSIQDNTYDFPKYRFKQKMMDATYDIPRRKVEAEVESKYRPIFKTNQHQYSNITSIKDPMLNLAESSYKSPIYANKYIPKLNPNNPTNTRVINSLDKCYTSAYAIDSKLPKASPNQDYGKSRIRDNSNIDCFNDNEVTETNKYQLTSGRRKNEYHYESQPEDNDQRTNYTQAQRPRSKDNEVTETNRYQPRIGRRKNEYHYESQPEDNDQRTNYTQAHRPRPKYFSSNETQTQGGRTPNIGDNIQRNLYIFNEQGNDEPLSQSPYVTPRDVQQRQSMVESSKIRLLKRERTELKSANHHIERQVKTLRSVPTFNSQELTDILSNFRDYGRSIKDHDKLTTSFLKSVLSCENVLLQTSPETFNRMILEVERSEDLLAEFRVRLDEADEVIRTEKITVSQMATSDSKELQYSTFSGAHGQGDKNVYEFLESMEENFKILRTPHHVKSIIMKKQLRGSAQMSIPESLNDSENIKEILLNKFGDVNEIYSNILNLHKKVGGIPSELSPSPEWAIIEETSKKHLEIIKKAESLRNCQEAPSLVFSSQLRNHELMKYLPHNHQSQLLKLKGSINANQFYNIIKNQIEEILNNATRMGNNTCSKRKNKPQEVKSYDDLGNTDFAQCYTNNNKYYEAPRLGRANDDDCQVCKVMQRDGLGEAYYLNHVIHKTSRGERVYNNKCPNYLRLTMKEKLDFLMKNKFCLFCLVHNCQNTDCIERNRRTDRGRKWGFVCRHGTCPNRIELCLQHQEYNAEGQRFKHNNFKEKFNIEYNLGLVIEPDTVNKIDAKLQGNKQNTPISEASTSIHDKVTKWLDSISSNVARKEKNGTLNIPTAKEAIKEQLSSPIQPAQLNSVPVSIQNEQSIKHEINFLEPRPQNTETAETAFTDGAVMINANNIDRPLLLNSKEELFNKAQSTLGLGSRSVFMYSKIKGLTRDLATLFDSGGGSSLADESVPGRQVLATKTSNQPVYLHGIGSGTKRGEQYNILLPLLDGTKCAIEVFAVGQILQPLNKLDLGPALTYLKNETAKNDSVSVEIKNEVAKARIYQYISGSLDLLLGIKTLAIFPAHVHSLPCGLSIFKMKLQTGSSKSTYCLGGPWACLDSMSAYFPEGSLLLQQLDIAIQNWRESCNSVTHYSPNFDTNPFKRIDSDQDKSTDQVGKSKRKKCNNNAEDYTESENGASILSSVDRYLDGLDNESSKRKPDNQIAWNKESNLKCNKWANYYTQSNNCSDISTSECDSSTVYDDEISNSTSSYDKDSFDNASNNYYDQDMPNDLICFMISDTFDEPSQTENTERTINNEVAKIINDCSVPSNTMAEGKDTSQNVRKSKEIQDILKIQICHNAIANISDSSELNDHKVPKLILRKMSEDKCSSSEPTGIFKIDNSDKEAVDVSVQSNVATQNLIPNLKLKRVSETKSQISKPSVTFKVMKELTQEIQTSPIDTEFSPNSKDTNNQIEHKSDEINQLPVCNCSICSICLEKKDVPESNELVEESNESRKYFINFNIDKNITVKTKLQTEKELLNTLAEVLEEKNNTKDKTKTPQRMTASRSTNADSKECKLTLENGDVKTFSNQGQLMKYVIKSKSKYKKLTKEASTSQQEKGIEVSKNNYHMDSLDNLVLDDLVLSAYNKYKHSDDIQQAVLQYIEHQEVCDTENLDMKSKISSLQLAKQIERLLSQSDKFTNLRYLHTYLVTAGKHLHDCSQRNLTPKLLQENDPRPNYFLALELNEEFQHKILQVQCKFLREFPLLRKTLTTFNGSHITMLAFYKPPHIDLDKINKFTKEAVVQWIKSYCSPPHDQGFQVDFLGVDSFDDQILYLKPNGGSDALRLLNRELLQVFEREKIHTDKQYTPHCTFAKQRDFEKKFDSSWNAKIKNTDTGPTKFFELKLFSIKDKTSKGLNVCLNTFNFQEISKDYQLCKPVSTNSDPTQKVSISERKELVLANEEEENSTSSKQSSSSNANKIPALFKKFYDPVVKDKSIREQLRKGFSTYLLSRKMTTLESEPEKDPIQPRNATIEETKAAINSAFKKQPPIQEFVQESQANPASSKPLNLNTIGNACDENENIHGLIEQLNIANNTQNNQIAEIHNVSYKGLLSDLKLVLTSPIHDYRCPKCTACAPCRSHPRLESLTAKEHKEEYILKSCVMFDDETKSYITKLPLLEDPCIALAPNEKETKSDYIRLTHRLKNAPKNKEAILESFNNLIGKGYIVKFENIKDEVKIKMKKKGLNFITWNFVFKKSPSTPCRLVQNGSKKTKSGKSLNNILAKGSPKLEMMPAVVCLFSESYLVSFDLSKAFNSIKLDEENWNLQCIWFNNSLDPNIEPEIFCIITMTYGLASSSRILEYCLLDIAERHKDQHKFYSMMTKSRFVDDGFSGCKSLKEADMLKRKTNEILPQYGFKIKGFVQSYSKPDGNMSIDGKVSALGYAWSPEDDYIQINVPPLYFEERERGQIVAETFQGTTFEELCKFVPAQLTLKQCTSKIASIFDPAGLCTGWRLGVKHLLRLTTRSVDREWEAAISDDLRMQWCKKFWEFIMLKDVYFKRCTFPLSENYDNLTIVCLSDWGKIGKQQLFYSIKRAGNGNFYTQLIYGRSNLSDDKSVPCQELEGCSDAVPLLDKICGAFDKVDQKALLLDSTIACCWICKEPSTLALFQKNRVNNILRYLDKSEIYHIPSTHNSSDVGTKRIEPLTVILPGSLHNAGPQIFNLGFQECVNRGFIRNISDVKIDPKNRSVALDGVVYRNMPQEYLGMAILPTEQLVRNEEATERVATKRKLDQVIAFGQTQSTTSSLKLTTNTSVIDPVKLNRMALDQLNKFTNPEDLLKKFITKRTGVEKVYYRLKEIMQVLKEIIREEKLFDMNNPSMILSSQELENALNQKVFHVTETRHILSKKLTPVAEYSFKHGRKPIRVIESSQTEARLPISATVANQPQVFADKHAKFRLKPKLLQLLRTLPQLDNNKDLFTFAETAKFFSLYIQSRAHAIFDPRNIKAAIVTNDPLGQVFGVKAFHRCQAQNLLLSQIEKIHPHQIALVSGSDLSTDESSTAKGSVPVPETTQSTQPPPAHVQKTNKHYTQAQTNNRKRPHTDIEEIPLDLSCKRKL